MTPSATHSAGERKPRLASASPTELVLTTERPNVEPNLLVGSAAAAARQFEAHGGSIEVPPFDIPVGRVAVVRDSFGNPLVAASLHSRRPPTPSAKH